MALNLRRKMTTRNDRVAERMGANVPSNLRETFERLTNQVMLRRGIISELNGRVNDYEQWIFGERKRAEKILKER